MQQLTPTRAPGISWVGAVYKDKQRRKLLIAVALLLAAIAAVLVRNGGAWFGDDSGETTAAEGEPTVSSPSTRPPTLNAPPEVATPVASNLSSVATPGRTRSSHAPGTGRRAGNSVKPEHQLASTSLKPSTAWGPATTAAERERASDSTPAHKQPVAYPLLTEATAVQGSVLLQALIGVDGGVQELRVISGPTILVSAARQAVQQWRFKPYLVNGKPVETYARVTVNFTIDVSNTEARYHINSVTSTGAL
jgi:TonB family protein